VKRSRAFSSQPSPREWRPDDFVAHYLHAHSLRESLTPYAAETPPTLDSQSKARGREWVDLRLRDASQAMHELASSQSDDARGDVAVARLWELGVLVSADRSPTQRRGRPRAALGDPWETERLFSAWDDVEPRRRAVKGILKAFGSENYDAAAKCARQVQREYLKSGDAAQARVAHELEYQVFPIICAWKNPRRFMRSAGTPTRTTGPFDMHLEKGRMLDPRPAFSKWGPWAIWNPEVRRASRVWLSSRAEGPDVEYQLIAQFVAPESIAEQNSATPDEMRKVLALEELENFFPGYSRDRSRDGRPKGAKTTRGTGEDLHRRRRRLFDEAYRRRYEDDGEFEPAAVRLAVGDVAASERVTRSAIWKSLRKTGFRSHT